MQFASECAVAVAKSCLTTSDARKILRAWKTFIANLSYRSYGGALALRQAVSPSTTHPRQEVNPSSHLIGLE
jgi:hypothetical protein